MNKVSKGVYISPDGRRYEGEWLDSAMHGQGIYLWQDGRRYEGEYMHDKKHGYGVYTWADGRIYEGEWALGKQHGKGRYIQADGTVRVGLWQNGNRLRWLEGENIDKSQRPLLSSRQKSRTSRTFDKTPEQRKRESHSHLTNLSLSSMTQQRYSQQLSAAPSLWMIHQSDQKDLDNET